MGAVTGGKNLVAAFAERLERRDWVGLAELLDPDVVYEIPQSHERIRGRDRYVTFNAEYPGDWHLEPQVVLGDDRNGSLLFRVEARRPAVVARHRVLRVPPRPHHQGHRLLAVAPTYFLQPRAPRRTLVAGRALSGSVRALFGHCSGSVPGTWGARSSVRATTNPVDRLATLGTAPL